MLAIRWLTSKPTDRMTWQEDRQVKGQTVRSDDDCHSVYYSAQTLWTVDFARVCVYWGQLHRKPDSNQPHRYSNKISSGIQHKKLGLMRISYHTRTYLCQLLLLSWFYAVTTRYLFNISDHIW